MNALIAESENIHAQAYFQFIKLSSHIENAVKQAIKKLGITHIQLNILSILYKNQDNSLGLIDIKKQLIVLSPDLSRMIDRLVLKGLVERNTCPANRRKIDLMITKKGIKVFEKGHHLAKAASNDFFQNLIDKKEAKQLQELLNKIYQGFNSCNI